MEYILYDYKVSSTVPEWLTVLIKDASSRATAACLEIYPSRYFNNDATRYDHNMYIKFMNEYTEPFNGRYEVVDGAGRIVFASEEDATVFRLRYCL
jgi:hypothetical protein